MLSQQGDLDVIPKGWLTRQQVCALFKKSQVTTDKLLKRLLDKNLIQRKLFRTRIRSGVRPVPYFFLKVASGLPSKVSLRPPRQR
jgi:hypothetical protein